MTRKYTNNHDIFWTSKLLIYLLAVCAGFSVATWSWYGILIWLLFFAYAWNCPIYFRQPITIRRRKR